MHPNGEQMHPGGVLTSDTPDAGGVSWSIVLLVLLLAGLCSAAVWHYLNRRKRISLSSMMAAGDTELSAADQALLDRLRNRDYIASVRCSPVAPHCAPCDTYALVACPNPEPK